MAELDEALLDQRLGELEKLRTWGPRVVSKLESFIRTGDDWALFHVNPYTFANERGIDEEEVVDLFLLACKSGIFQMSWSLLCPGCGDAVQSFASLRNICSVFRCMLCSVDSEARLDEFVHVSFTVAPRIRRIPAHAPDSLPVEDFHLRYHFAREARVAPGGMLFVDALRDAFFKGMSYVEPRAQARFQLDLGQGIFCAYDMITGGLMETTIDPAMAGPNPPFRVRFRDGAYDALPKKVAAGPIELTVDNQSDQRISTVILFKSQAFIDDYLAKIAAGADGRLHFDRFLSGRRLLTSQTFRQAFGAETIRSSDGMSVRDISFVFTDLKGSTALYDRIGDLKAFTLVNQHFERLARAIAQHRGAIVKTIGDAVMASFERPADAVAAARAMLTEIEDFNKDEGAREIVLKVGIHRGASIAVTLNDRLDFFGQTVNIAARVQGLADAEEIFVTDDVHSAEGVAALLEGMYVERQSVALKGVQRRMVVHRIALSPPAKPAPVRRPPRAKAKVKARPRRAKKTPRRKQAAARGSVPAGRAKRR